MPVSRVRSGQSDENDKGRKRPRKVNENVAAEVPPDDDEEQEEEFEDHEEGGRFVEDIYIPPKQSITERPTHGERLIIEQIECENFKSYGGIKRMGPFHKSFSAIIGPNGNGKSNIIDAMLFVFGYRANKIRCKKLSVLIHKSELLKDINSCSVKVHFLKIIDNGEEGDEMNVVPNSRITVTRRAFKNNSSSYYLNERKVTFQDVTRFLRQNGIDIVHNRFLILQGEVEQIAQMPPKATNSNETGFLEFIDEIIGTKRYEKPLIKLRERMEELDFQREEKSQRVTLAEQHKNGLVEPMRKATKFLQDRNAKISTNHVLNQVKAFQYRKRMTGRKEELQELDEQRTAINTRLEEIKKYNDERRHEYAEAEKEYQIAEAKLKKNKKQMEDAEVKHNRLNHDLTTTNDERKKKKAEKAKVEAELEKLHGLPERHAAEIEKLEKRKSELEEQIEAEDEATKEKIAQVNQKIEKAVAEKKKADATLRKYKEVVDGKKVAVETLKKELERGKQKEEAEKAKLEKLRKELEELENNVKRKSGQGDVNIDPNELAAKARTANGLKQEAADLESVEMQKRSLCTNLRGQYHAAKESAEGGRITNTVDKQLFEAKAQGQFPGLYGRMKDLATIEEKYNIGATVSTGMLDYWIVDNDQTGAECIQFLKDRRLPSQSFLCLSKMGQNVEQCRQPFRTPPNSKRIFDLLKLTKPETAPAYYKAFRDTLICENMDIGTVVSYGGRTRYRVATYNGEIIETAGTLIGGGRPPTQGKFNSETAKRLGNAVSKQQLDAMKRQLDQAEEELNEIFNKRRELTDAAFNIEKEIAETKAKVSKYQADLESSKKMIPMKTQLVKEQEETYKKARIPDALMKEKTKKIEGAQEELEEANVPFEEAQEAVQTLADKISRLNEEEKSEILKKLTKLKEQFKRVKDEINKLNVEIKNFEKNKDKANTKIVKLQKEVESCQEKMLALNEEKKALEETAKGLKAEQDQLSSEKEEKEKVYVELKSKANEFDKEEKKLNKDKVVTDNKYQTLHDEIMAIEREESKLTASLETFELAEIPEVEVEPLKMLTEEELQSTNVKELEARLEKYTNKLKREEPNLNIIDDYKAACETLLKRINDLDAINQRRDTINEAYLTVEAQRMKEFMEGYAQISAKVKELFRMISMGGDAELDLLDSTDPFSCGIDFSVRPRGKTWKKIINLSGGEKTLSSLALVFSLHHFKPSPFYVMDEIDAALDFQNVSIIANYIKDRTKFTQFIIISLRSNMFELADSLLGVYKVDNMSYSIHIGVNSIVQQLKKKFEEKGRPFLMGQDDHNSMASRRPGTGTLSQGTTVSASQATTVQADEDAVGASVPQGKPSLDISAIGIHDASTVSVGISERPMSVASTTTTYAKSEPEPRVEDMELSEDVFENSFEAAGEQAVGPIPLHASTPASSVVGAPVKRQPVRDLSAVNEAESSEDDDSDSDHSAVMSDALSSVNNSQDDGPS